MDFGWHFDLSEETITLEVKVCGDGEVEQVVHDLQTDHSVPKPTQPYHVKDVRPGENGKIVITIQGDVALAMPLAEFKPEGIISAYLASAAVKSPDAFSLAFHRAQNLFLNSEKIDDNQKGEEPNDTTNEQSQENDEHYGTDDEDEKMSSQDKLQTKDSDETTMAKEAQQMGRKTAAGAENRDVEESEDEDDAWKIENKFRQIQEIPIDQLVEPSKKLRVRPINERRVKELTKSLLERKQTTLRSVLTVLEQQKEGQGSYVVVDGNHRLRACRYIRGQEGKTDRFKTLTCQVYSQLNSAQALSLGFSRNQEAADIYEMSDYDIVMNIRKIIQQLKEDDAYSQDRLNELLGATDRKDNQPLQKHLHVAQFSKSCFDIIKKGFSQGKFKSSTFDCLRGKGMTDEKKLESLRRFEESGWKKTSLKLSTLTKKARKKEEPPLTLRLEGDLLIVHKGSAHLASASVCAFGITVSSKSFEQAIRDGLASIVATNTKQAVTEHDGSDESDCYALDLGHGSTKTSSASVPKPRQQNSAKTEALKSPPKNATRKEKIGHNAIAPKKARKRKGAEEAEKEEPKAKWSPTRAPPEEKKETTESDAPSCEGITLNTHRLKIGDLVVIRKASDTDEPIWIGKVNTTSVSSLKITWLTEDSDSHEWMEADPRKWRAEKILRKDILAVIDVSYWSGQGAMPRGMENAILNIYEK